MKKKVGLFIQTLTNHDSTRRPTLVCICTLGNNRNLEKLIEQILEIGHKKKYDFRLLVVVNDSPPLSVALPRSVEIVHCTEVGYASVRNFAIKNRRSDENLYFLDDDEIFTILENGSDPLGVMLSASVLYPHSLLTGPVYALDETTHKLLSPTYRNTNPTYKTGQKVNYLTGGNLFISSGVFERMNVQFDTRFNFGGEDKELSDRFSRLGIASRWVKEAAIYELAPKMRSNPEWLLMREAKNTAIFFLSGWKNLGISWKVKFFILMTSGFFYYWILSKLIPWNGSLGIQYRLRREALYKVRQVRNRWKLDSGTSQSSSHRL